MADVLNYKSYSRGQRNAVVEDDFQSGMNYTDNSLEDTFVKTLVNYDYKDDGLVLVPRGGFQAIDTIEVPLSDSKKFKYPFAAYTTNIDLLDNKHLEDYRTRCFIVAESEEATAVLPEYSPERKAILFPNKEATMFIQDLVTGEFSKSTLTQKLPEPENKSPIIIDPVSSNLQMTHKPTGEFTVKLNQEKYPDHKFKVTSADVATVTAVADEELTKVTLTAVKAGGPISITISITDAENKELDPAVTTRHTVTVYAADSKLPEPPAKADDTQYTIAFLGEGYNSPQIVHGFPLKTKGPHKPIYTTLNNTAYILYRQQKDNTLGFGKIHVVKKEDAYFHKCVPVKPIDLSVKEVMSSGYNMLLPNPYDFKNREGPGYVVDGILPYTSADEDRELLLSARPGQRINFEVFYQYKVEANVKLRAKWEWLDPNSNSEWQVLQTELATNTANPDALISEDYTLGAPIRIDFDPTVAQFQLRVSLYKKTGTTIDTKPIKMMVMPIYKLSTESGGNTKNLKPVKYNLATASGMTTWKQRVIVWGVSGAENIVFASDINNPAYFPYPNNIDIFDENIIHIAPYMDNLVVFTETRIYMLGLTEDGLGFTTQLIQHRLGISPLDKHVIQTIKNMIYFKSDNYYYMIVPKTNSIRGELLVAPVSKPIINLLDGFREALDEVLQTLYFKTIPREYDMEMINYYNYVDNTVVKNVYTFQLSPPEGALFQFEPFNFNVVLNYDTAQRTWTMHSYQCNYAMLPFKQTITDSTVLLDVCNRTNGSGEIINIVAQLLRQNPLDPKDNFQLNNTTDDRVFPNYQYLDTGYRKHGAQHNKRFREVQMKLNNTSKRALEFYTEFMLDDQIRTSYYKYVAQHLVDPNDPNYGLIYIEKQIEPTLTVSGTTMLSDVPMENNCWTLDMSKLPPLSVVKVRFPVSGKGYTPRLKLISFNERTYELLNVNWVFRTMYMR